jgi:hypothetical protein
MAMGGLISDAKIKKNAMERILICLFIDKLEAITVNSFSID